MKKNFDASLVGGAILVGLFSAVGQYFGAKSAENAAASMAAKTTCHILHDAGVLEHRKKK